MSEWWSYRLSDLLLFSARSYYRLFELYNTELWPGQVVAIVFGLAIVFLSLRAGPGAARAACVLLAACWLWVGWAFHLQRYAAINWAAIGFAAAFVVEGMLLLLAGGVFGKRSRIRALHGRRAAAGLGLLLFALAVQPWIGVLQGRPWRQAELFGLAPDPTAVATLGLLLLLQPIAEARPVLARMLWPIPLLWCMVSGATLWTMQAADAWLMPAAALLAVLAAWRSR